MVLKKRTSGAAARVPTGCARGVTLWGQVCCSFCLCGELRSGWLANDHGVNNL